MSYHSICYNVIITDLSREWFDNNAVLWKHMFCILYYINIYVYINHEFIIQIIPYFTLNSIIL